MASCSKCGMFLTTTQTIHDSIFHKPTAPSFPDADGDGIPNQSDRYFGPGATPPSTSPFGPNQGPGSNSLSTGTTSSSNTSGTSENTRRSLEYQEQQRAAQLQQQASEINAQRTAQYQEQQRAAQLQQQASEINAQRTAQYQAEQQKWTAQPSGGGSTSGGTSSTSNGGALGGWSESLYLKRYPDVAAAVKNGVFRSGLQHYQLHGKSEGRQGNFIPKFFDETAYLRANPDVAAAVRSGGMASGLDHYLKFGGVEGRNGTFVEGIIDNMIANNDKNGDGKLTPEELGNKIWLQYTDEARKDGVVTRQEAIDLVKQRVASGIHVSDTQLGGGKTDIAINKLMGQDQSNFLYSVKQVEQKLGAKLPDWIAQDGQVSETELGTFISNQVKAGNLKFTSEGGVALTKNSALANPPTTSASGTTTTASPVATVSTPAERVNSDSVGAINDSTDIPTDDSTAENVGSALELESEEDGEVAANGRSINSTQTVDDAENDESRFWVGGSIETAIENHFGAVLQANGGTIPAHTVVEELDKLGVQMPSEMIADGKLTEREVAHFIRDQISDGNLEFTPQGGLRSRGGAGGIAKESIEVGNQTAVQAGAVADDKELKEGTLSIDHRDKDDTLEHNPVEPRTAMPENSDEASLLNTSYRAGGSNSSPTESQGGGGETLAAQTSDDSSKVYVSKGGSVTKMIQDIAAEDGKKLTGREAWKIYESMKEDLSTMDNTYRMENGHIGLSKPGEMRVDSDIVAKIKTLSDGQGSMQAARVGDNSNSGVRTVGETSSMGLANGSRVNTNASGTNSVFPN